MDMWSGITTKLVSEAGVNLPRRRVFGVRSEELGVRSESVVWFCGWLVVFWALWLLQARSAMRVIISVMCFILR